MLLLLNFITVPVGLILVLTFLNKPYNPPLFGVYQQKNKCFLFKFVFMYAVLTIRQLFIRIRRAYAVELGSSCDGTIEIHREDDALERKFYLGDYSNGMDGVYFNGVTEDGAAVICGISRRSELLCDAFLCIKLNGEELYLSPHMPDTCLQQTNVESGNYSVKGLEITKFIPMRTWQIKYNGEMKLRNNPSKTVKVDVQFTWSALWAPFNYNFQSSPRSIAKDIAREEWSLDYFKLLLKFRQTHYEQMGTLKGTVTLDGKEQFLRVPCVRQHTYGKHRDESTFHRYVIHYIFLDNGDSMVIGTVSQPVIISHLTIGYLCRKADQAVLPVESCDFRLYQHGENQIMPRDYGFTFRTGREQYTVRVQVDDEEIFYIGKDRESKIYVRWSRVEVNDVKGRACVEWQYNNKKKTK